MSNPRMLEQLQKHQIPGRVTVVNGNGGLPKIEITTSSSTAEIYPHGAHVTAFQKKDELPLLFMSQSSQYVDGKPIRGGVPIVFPWFGPKEGAPAHGFARLNSWSLQGSTVTPNGAVQLKFELPDQVVASNGIPARVAYTVTVSDTLTMEFTAMNCSSTAALPFENCLHTYFSIGDINDITITGLKGITCIDKVKLERYLETADAIRIQSEVDRVYLSTQTAVEIHDTKLRRKIRVEKSGSASTVVWNPWIAKSKQMPDFGDEEFKKMVCVESGNVAENKISLEPGKSATLKVVLNSEPL